MNELLAAAGLAVTALAVVGLVAGLLQWLTEDDR